MKLFTTLLLAIPALTSIVGLLWLTKRRKKRKNSSGEEEVKADLSDAAKLSEENTNNFKTNYSPHQNTSEKLKKNKIENNLRKDNINLEVKAPNSYMDHENYPGEENIHNETKYLNGMLTADNISEKVIVDEVDIKAINTKVCQGEMVSQEISIQDGGNNVLNDLPEEQSNQELQVCFNKIERENENGDILGASPKKELEYNSVKDQFILEDDSNNENTIDIKLGKDENGFFEEEKHKTNNEKITDINSTTTAENYVKKETSSNIGAENEIIKMVEEVPHIEKLIKEESIIDVVGKMDEVEVEMNVEEVCDEKVNELVGFVETVTSNEVVNEIEDTGVVDCVELLHDDDEGNDEEQDNKKQLKQEDIDINDLRIDKCCGEVEEDLLMQKDKIVEIQKKSWCDLMDEEMEEKDEGGKKKKRKSGKRKSYDGPNEDKNNGKNDRTTNRKNNGKEKGKEDDSLEKDLKSPRKHETKRSSNEKKKEKNEFKEIESFNNNNNNKVNHSTQHNEISKDMIILMSDKKDVVNGDCLVGEMKNERNGGKLCLEEDQGKVCMESRSHLDSGLESATSLSSPQQLFVIDAATEQEKVESPGVYYFLFPADLCGLLIGRQGKNIKDLCDLSGASIMVDHKVEGVESNELHQVVTIYGSGVVITKALELLKNRFSPSKFPTIDFNPLPVPAYSPSPLFTPHPFLTNGVNLPSTGEWCGVVVSMVNSPDHVFLHLPSHPCYIDPFVLNNNINFFYQRATSRPQIVQSLLLPQPIACDTLCIAWVNNAFYRASVAQTGAEECLLKFVDFGGFNTVPHHSIYKISDDFAQVPFQSLECYLSNITPLPGSNVFSEEAIQYFEKLVTDDGSGALLEACVAGYDVTDGIPYIQLFKTSALQMNDVVSLMVEAGHATTPLQNPTTVAPF